MSATWRQRALVALADLAREGAPFTSDDLIERVGVPDDDHSANGVNSGIGSVFRELSTRHVIAATGRVTKSRQPHRKGGVVQVWVGVHEQPTLLDLRAGER